MLVSDILRRELKHGDVSAYAIAKRTGISESRLSKFKSGAKGLSLEAVDEICVVLGLTLRQQEATDVE